jgi:hypothetical protein
LVKFQNRTFLSSFCTSQQNMQFCKQNMAILVIFGLCEGP